MLNKNSGITNQNRIDRTVFFFCDRGLGVVACKKDVFCAESIDGFHQIFPIRVTWIWTVYYHLIGKPFSVFVGSMSLQQHQ